MIDADRLAAELIAGPWSRTPLELRAVHHLGSLVADESIRMLVRSLLERWPTRPGLPELIAFLAQAPEPVRDEPAPQGLTPSVPPRLHRPMVAVCGREDLSRLLWLDSGELDWFADVQARGARLPPGPLQHYRYRWLATPGKLRVLEIPKPRLKEIQRRLLRHLVRSIPLHPCAHGAVSGRSVRSCLQPHADRPVLVRCDLESFFASITGARVRGLYRTIGMDDATAAVLAGLSTSAVPVQVRRLLPGPLGLAGIEAQRRALHRLASPHLPQGAPTSPGLANAIAFSLDHRLDALAASLGARYTRYVDDLIFSGPAGLAVGALLGGVRDIARGEGFRLAERKTAVLRSSRRQSALGAVVNRSVSIDRRELDLLQAILHNCLRHGPFSQARGRDLAEFRAYLQGRISWVSSLHEASGQRLRDRFQQISWDVAADGEL